MKCKKNSDLLHHHGLPVERVRGRTFDRVRVVDFSALVISLQKSVTDALKQHDARKEKDEINFFF